jgi:small subunit ribosomal protein S4
MARYTGPRIRIIRRLGPFGLTRKTIKNRTKTPGQHGKLNVRLADDYKDLFEKQKNYVLIMALQKSNLYLITKKQNVEKDLPEHCY